jgi:short-subunit dehydrogenase
MEPGWAVVTGASGGIGAAFARLLAARGHKILAVARGGEALARVVGELRAARAVVEPLTADLATIQGVEAVAARALALGDVEILVNNAGLSTSGNFLDQSFDKELALIRVNVEAVFALTRRLVPHMARRGRGRIINVASIVGFQPVPYWATYAATKAFVLSFGEALAIELRGTGVHVVTVCPGFTRTALYAESGMPGLAGRFLPSASPEQVASAALAASDRRRVLCVFGVMNRALVLASRVGPRFVVRRLMGVMFRPRPAP